MAMVLLPTAMFSVNPGLVWFVAIGVFLAWLAGSRPKLAMGAFLALLAFAFVPHFMTDVVLVDCDPAGWFSWLPWWIACGIYL